MEAAPYPDADPTDGLLTVLSLSTTEARTTEDIFTGVSHPMPRNRVFGGQVLAQSVLAASRTVETDRPIHSMHGYFLRPGDTGHGITFAVDRLRDGRSFTARRTQAFQQGVPIFSMIASFQAEEDGLDHSEPMPDVPDPDDIAEPDTTRLHPLNPRSVIGLPLQARHVEGSLWNGDEVASSARQNVWIRVRRRLPDDPLLHRAALAYMSDMSIQEPVLRAHGLSWSASGVNVASLDHAMWWHRPARADEWLLYSQVSPNARGARGLSTGRLYTRDGVLVASVAQEIMVRVPSDQRRA